MAPAPAETAPVTEPRREALYRVLLFLLLVVTTYTFPRYPEPDLDSSWRMALGKYLLDGLQFGHDVVFTYGPLGFLMGKTYYGSGILFKAMLAWQLFAAVCFTLVIMLWGERLRGWPKFFYYAFFLLLGTTYDDALHMLGIIMVGAELLRRSDGPWRWSSALLLVFTAILGVIKFTNLVLALIVVAVLSTHALWRRRPRAAAWPAAWFGGAFLVLWMACRQNPLNLPEYFHNSWIISQGYQQAMGIPAPTEPLWKALVVIGLLIAYLIVSFLTQKDRGRATAYSVMLGAFLYLNWKHGFVRADGHMVGFFYCALLPVVAFPLLLEDTPARHRLKRWLLVPAGVLCILGTRDTLSGMVDYSLAIFQGKIWTNVGNLSRLPTLRNAYNDQLGNQRNGLEMPHTRARIGDHSVDVLGFEQSAALFNRFNYQPRPVIQSYSAYTPELAKLNADFYASDRAPDFVLVKIHSIDERLPGMDDSAALNLIAHRYTYVLTEKTYQLWQKKPGPFDATRLAPRPLAAKPLGIGEPWTLDAYADRRLWVNVDLAPSLLGRLRNFFYKPPEVRFLIEDTSGYRTNYRLPTPLGRAGFVLSPMIEDTLGFLNFSTDTVERQVHAITVQIAETDRKYFAAEATVSVSELAAPSGKPRPIAGTPAVPFHLFNVIPTASDTLSPPTDERIDGQPVMIVHAPSELTFNVPAGLQAIDGKLGFLPGAYTNGGNTNGADFYIVWSNGKDAIEFYHRFLDPVHKAEDRGLQTFHLDVSRVHGGRFYFRILPGPFNDTGWDWTGWSEVQFSSAK